jgi:hypothetical protein
MSRLDCGCSTAPREHAGRRRFLKFAALSAGAALLDLHLPRLAKAAETDALLLSCIDFRLIDGVVAYMDGHGMKGRYDQVILAGASLGAVTPRFPAWNETFWEHLKIAIELHKVHEMFVMDHRDCGAYKLVFGQDFASDRTAETAIHAKTMRELREAVRKRHPAMEVNLMLMNLDGSVEDIAA